MKISKTLENLALVVFACLVIAVFATNAISRSCMNEYTELLENSYGQRIEQVARMAASLIPLTELDKLQSPEDMYKPVYKEVKEKLIGFAERNEVLFVYYIRKDADGNLFYIVDNDTDPKTMVTPGDATESDNVVDGAFSGDTVRTQMGSYAGGWDGLMSAYAPVYQSEPLGDEDISIVAGVDIKDTTIYNIMKQNNDIQVVVIVEIIAVVIVGVFLLFVLRQRAAEYREASMAKSDFLSRMSHEIRTPMNAIVGLSRMAWESDDLTKIHHFIENITNSSNYLLSLLNNILDISKIEAGKMGLELSVVRFNVLAISLRTMLSPQALEKKIAIEIETADDLPEAIMADSTRLTQIIMNLMGNALKFTPKGGMIALGIRMLDQNGKRCHVEFTVKDSGIGIEKQYIAKLFDPFEQGDGSTTRKFGGTGLGLAISRMLVEMMGGHIRVDSEIGKGSTFTFDIYADTYDESACKDTEPVDVRALSDGKAAPGQLDLSGKTVLVVEDNDINQMIAEDAFSRFGAEVEFANNGQEGLDAYLADPKRYDIIFMDIQMPVMDGIAATKEIRASGASTAETIPIIAMTANVFAEDIEKTKAAGMNAHIGKPFELIQIEQAIKEALKGQGDR